MFYSIRTASLPAAQQLRDNRSKPLLIGLVSSLILALNACTPTVQVAAPTEPITINLNIKIQHEILVKVDKQLDNLFSEDSDLF